MALKNSASATASFTAPAVTQNTDLVFALTVTDNVGQTRTDTTVTITVQPQGGGGDTTAPVTTGIFSRSVIKGKVVFAITLSANEPSTTHFRLTGLGTVSGGGSNTTAWQIYSGPVTVNLAKNGTANFDYYSDDTAGNVEATRTEVLQ